MIKCSQNVCIKINISEDKTKEYIELCNKRFNKEISEQEFSKKLKEIL